MPSHICCIVPPHLLQAIADSSENDHDHRQCAQRTLHYSHSIVNRRTELFHSLTQPRGYAHGSGSGITRPRPSIVPDHLLQAIVDSPDADEEIKACAKRDLEHIQKVHGAYQESQKDPQQAASQKTLAGPAATKPAPAAPFYRAVYTAQNNDDESKLPGKQLRLEGQPPSKDQSADDAFDNAGKVLEFYKKFFNWNSIDNKGMHVLSSVHFAKDYENAFWDPERMQMVYGDGSTFLSHFCESVDVIGHEMTHAVTEHTSPLDYQDQAGALNEHISDVFGIMVKQYVEQETADKADWLIGEGVLEPGVKGVALRSMKAPGTAYNDPRFGKDPQPNNMSGFKVTREDNGGVHIYSGIPNRAFYLFSVALGGFSYEKAGQVWWKTMNSGQIPPRCTFIQFADTTVDIADGLYGHDVAKKLRESWNTVGVVRKSHT